MKVVPGASGSLAPCSASKGLKRQSFGINRIVTGRLLSTQIYGIGSRLRASTEGRVVGNNMHTTVMTAARMRGIARLGVLEKQIRGCVSARSASESAGVLAVVAVLLKCGKSLMIPSYRLCCVHNVLLFCSTT